LYKYFAMNHDSTINPDELAFYEGLAAFWWDRSGPFWPLHQLNELRVDWILRQLCERFGLDRESARPLHGLRALDIGCGGGILSESIARLGAEVTGIDVVEKNIRIASVHARSQQLDIDYQHRTAESAAESGQAYDLVLNMEVVEHVADLPAFMASCNRLTAPNGVMFVATINRTWLAWLFAILGAEYLLKWLPKGTHRWSEFRKPSEIASLFNRGGLSLQAQSGVAVNPLTRAFRLTRSMNVNYMLMAAHPEDGV
jgi:2-polyprenyl-6-hydroxyphenyl methylase/3-demethylubiquinone-9 3-methyltransferase